MNESDRRAFLQKAALGAVTLTGAMNTDLQAGLPAVPKAAVPVLHVTDLYRPHADPDDHWDLACVYALAYQGSVRLDLILSDHSLHRYDRPLDPDVIAVAQMNYITGLAVPFGVGSNATMHSRDDVSASEHGGVRLIRQTLRQSPQPVVINILGSSRDVAIAGKKEPKLFAEKCRAIYLNAGTAVQGEKLDSNVKRDPLPYAAIFDLPCPVYWMPVFERQSGGSPLSVEEYGTYYGFTQGEILPHLSKRVRNFFTFMFKQGRFEKEETPSLAWLEYLLGEGDDAVLSHQNEQHRNMWCTAGFIHSAGKTVKADGTIVPLSEAGEQAVFTFEPIRVSANDEARTDWSRDPKSNKRFIFHVLKQEAYESAMTKAMKTLLIALPG